MAQRPWRRDADHPSQEEKPAQQTSTGILPIQPPTPQLNWALFLDVDGTLLEVAERPDRVIVPSTLIDLLRSLVTAFDGAVALVSGRPLAELDRLFSPLKLPAAGQHGAEWRHHGSAEIIYAPSALINTDLAKRIIEAGRDLPGILIERKPASIALHYRGNPRAGAELHRRLINIMKPYRWGFDILPGKMVWEVKPHGNNKGNAVRIFMTRAPFMSRVPVMLGDDITDCDAFRAVTDLAGHALAVGPLSLGDWPIVFADGRSARHWLARLPEKLKRAR